MPTPVPVSPSVSTSNRFGALSGLDDRATTRDSQGRRSPRPPSRLTPLQVGNVTAADPSRPSRRGTQLEERRALILAALADSGAEEAPQLRSLFERGFREAKGHAAREAVLQRYEKALNDRGIAITTTLNVLPDLFLNVANAVMGRMPLGVVSNAAPGLGSALALTQVAQAVYQRSWNGAAAALPALVPLLPPLRSIEQINAVFGLLPETLHDQFNALHHWVQQADDALSPDLGIRDLVPALAIGTLLWHVHSRLPSASGQLQGVAGFIAEMPRYWQKLAGLDRTVSALLAPPVSGALVATADILESHHQRLSPQEKAERVEQKKWFDQQHLQSGDAIAEPVISSLRPSQPPRSAPIDSGLGTEAGLPQRGGPIAHPPVTECDAATSSVAGLLSQWWRTLLAGVTSTAAGFNPVAQIDPVDVMDSIELGDAMEMGTMAPNPVAEPLTGVSVETPLMGTVAPAAGGAAGGVVGGSKGFFKRNPLAVATALVFSAAGGVAAAAYRLWPSAPESLSTTALADQLMGDVVSLGDAWGTGLDLLVGTPELPSSGRKRRAVADDEVTTTPEPPSDVSQLGLTEVQLNQVLQDATLTQNIQSLQAWALAIAQEVATQPGWEWVGRLPASEQELLVTQLRALQEQEPTLAQLQSQPQTLLDTALSDAGWTGDTAGITVDLGSSPVAGVPVHQQLPLLEYCLLRADGTTPKATFLRDGVAFSPAQQEQLLDFVGGDACRQLGDRVRQHAESLRPSLVSALTSRLIIDALKAKQSGTLGSGNTLLRGADIVLGYLQGRAEVESSVLTYADTLPDGTPISIHVPNYLVLRSASTDPALSGQVVLYRTDLASFQTFGNEQAFRQFLDTQRAQAGLHAVNGDVDHTLAKDIVAAAPPAQRAQVQERVRSWEQRYVLYQTGKHGPQAWNPSESFQLDFKPCTDATHALSDWANAVVTHSQSQQQRQLDNNRLRWTPLGLAHLQVDAETQTRLQEDLQTLQQHAHAEVLKAMNGALRQAGIDLQGLDPDRIWLRVGGQRMPLTAWATSGWQQQGLSRPVFPANLGDLPGEGIGQPANPVPYAPWPSSNELMLMDIIAYADGGQNPHTLDAGTTDALQSEDALRAICGVLGDFASSNRLGEAYIAHLKTLAAAPNSAFHGAIANQIRVHTRWMIEQAHQNGVLDSATYQALTAAHGALEPASGRPSSLQGVSLRGHAINGVWALKAGNTPYVFLPGTQAGDQLLTEAQFRLWLKQPEAEDYVLARTELRFHKDLDDMFRKKQVGNALKLEFTPTRGPKHAARQYIEARISDTDEMTISQLERFLETMTIVGSLVAGVACTVASAGSAALVCAATTMALVARGIQQGVKLLQEGDVDGAIQEFGSITDALDVLNIGMIPGLVARLGRQTLGTVSEATDALRQWRLQARGFGADGRMNDGFAVPRQTLSGNGAPMLEVPLTDGGSLFTQNGRDYLKLDTPDGGTFVETYVDDAGVRRLRMPEAPDQVGPPVAQDHGEWKRVEHTATSAGTTTPRPPNPLAVTTPVPPHAQHPWVQKVPEAENLPADKLDRLETVFGIRRAGTPPSADLRQKVRDLTMEGRIQQIINDPASLGLPGDEAIIMRAWADSAVLGNGRSVETYSQELGEWTRGARFGKGPVGMMVEVDNARLLPTLDALIEASDQDALLTRLKLPAGTSHDALREAVRTELARTIAANPAQSLLSWQRWALMQHRLPTAPDNLIKHFPQLTKLEAEALVAGDRVLELEAQSWVFSGSTVDKVSDILAKRGQREKRESVLNNQFDSPSKVQELGNHLREVLPGRDWVVTPSSSGEGSVLSFINTGDKENKAIQGSRTVRSLTFMPDGKVGRPTELGTLEPVSSWEDGIYNLLSPTSKEAVPSSSALRTSVLEHMKDTPVATTCVLTKPLGKGKNIKKRALDCEVAPSIVLTDHDVVQRDALGSVMHGVRERMSTIHAQLSLEELEFKQLASQNLQLKKLKQTLEPEALARFKELEKKQFGNLKSFDIMNFASYQLEGLTYKGAPVVLPDTFPLQGTAGSGNPRPILATEGVVEGVPVRRVLLTEEEAVGNPTFSGLYREEYAMGADLAPVLTGRGAEKSQPSAKIVLTEKDLLVTRPGSKQKVPVHELTDEEILQLDITSYSPTLRKHIGDAGLHPGNARSLKPGEYRMYQIRSCSEGKILDNWFAALSATVPELAPQLKGLDNGPIRSLNGKLYLFSEMNPCAVSCERRLTELMDLMPGMEIKVFYQYDDNAHRKEWIFNQKVSRVIDKYRDEWEAAGMAELDMHGKAQSELLKPEVSRWVEDDFKQRPMEEPVARLWVPTETNEF